MNKKEKAQEIISLLTYSIIMLEGEEEPSKADKKVARQSLKEATKLLNTL